MSLTVYSQSIVVIKGDTNVCFTVPKAKILLKQSYKIKELQEVIDLCDTEREIYDSINKNNEELIANHEELNKDCKEQLNLKEFQIQEEKQNTAAAQKETRKQKTGKILAIVIGTVVAILEAVLFVGAK